MEHCEVIELGKNIDDSFHLYFETKNRSHIDILIQNLKKDAKPNWDEIAASENVVDNLIRYILAGYIMELFSFYIKYQDRSDLKDILEGASDIDETIKWFIIHKKYSKIKKRIKADIIDFFRLHKELDRSIHHYFFDGNSLKFWFPEHDIDKYESLDKYERVDRAIKEYGISLSRFDADEIMIVKELYADLFLSNKIYIKRKMVEGCTYIKIREMPFLLVLVFNLISLHKVSLYPYYVVEINFNESRDLAAVRYGYHAGRLLGGGETAIFKKYDGYWKYGEPCGQWIS
jgi:hypothetical protein